MAINNVLLASLIVSFLFEGTFFLSLALIYNSTTKKRLNILNTFVFEATPSFKEKNGYVNYLFLFSLLVILFSFVYFASNNLNAYTVSMMVLSLLSLFCLASLPFIPLDKLREHFYLDLGALTSLLATYGIEAFYSYHIYSIYLNNKGLVAMIISVVLGALVLIPIFYPRLFELRNIKNEDGTYSRKKFILLAFSEWMLYLISLLSLLPLFILTMA